MEKGENGLTNLLTNRISNLNSLQMRSDISNNNSNNLNSTNNSALMNAFNFSGLPLSLGLWDSQLISAAMSQYMEANNSLLNVKQNDNDNQNSERSEENSKSKCNKSDVLDLKTNNKRFKSNEGFLQNNHNNSDLNKLNNSKELIYPCPECHKTFATEVDLKMHILRHAMQHPFSCTTCGKGFKYDHTLAFHMKQHNVESNNKLNLKSSSKKSNLQQAIKNENCTNDVDKNNRKLNKFQSLNSKVSGQQEDEDELNNNIPTSLLASTSKINNLNNSSQKTSFSPSLEFGFPNSSLSNPAIQMKNEKVLIVMIDGVNPLNDQSYTLYKCNLCGYAFANLAPVTDHILNVHSNTNKLNCDKCGANFKWRNELILHDQLHKAMEQQQQANQCNKMMLPSLIQNNLMIVNQYLASEQNQNKIDSNNNDNLILNSNSLNGSLCQLNNKQINGNSDYFGLNLIKTQRKDSESSQESINLITKNKNTKQLKELRNDELDELSKNIAVVKENITNELGEIEETAPGQFKCRYCDKTFDRVFSVHRHERVHTGFKPCICKVCGRGFSEKRNLRHHIIRFHSDGSGRELLKRVRKDKSLNSEENNEAKRQLKQMEMNILSINNNSFQSNTGSDEDLPNNLTLKQNGILNINDENNHSDHSELNHKASSSRRKKSVPCKKISSLVCDQIDTEDDEKDELSSKSDQASIKMEDDDSCSNNEDQMND